MRKTIWAAMQLNGKVSLYLQKPTLNLYDSWEGGHYTIGIVSAKFFPNLTFETSPIKVSLVETKEYERLLISEAYEKLMEEK